MSKKDDVGAGGFTPIWEKKSPAERPRVGGWSDGAEPKRHDASGHPVPQKGGGGVANKDLED